MNRSDFRVQVLDVILKGNSGMVGNFLDRDATNEDNLNDYVDVKTKLGHFNLTPFGWCAVAFDANKQENLNAFYKFVGHRKINVNKICHAPSGRTVLHLACGSGLNSEPSATKVDVDGSPKMLHKLLQHPSIDVLALDGKHKLPAVYYAVMRTKRNQDKAPLRELVSRCPQFCTERFGKFKRTLLHFYCGSGFASNVATEERVLTPSSVNFEHLTFSPEIIQLMLRNGSRPDLQDSEGFSPLDYALRNATLAHVDGLACLLAPSKHISSCVFQLCKADYVRENREIDISAFKGFKEQQNEIIVRLLDIGVCFDKYKLQDTYTPTYYALQNREMKQETLKKLLKKSKPDLIFGSKKRSLLHFACGSENRDDTNILNCVHEKFFKSKDCVSALLHAGYSALLKDTDGYSPLYYHLMSPDAFGKREMTKILVASVAGEITRVDAKDINSISRFGKFKRTLLHLACGSGLSTIFTDKNPKDLSEDVESNELVEALLGAGFSPATKDVDGGQDSGYPPIAYALRSLVLEGGVLKRLYASCDINLQFGLYNRSLMHVCLGSSMTKSHFEGNDSLNDPPEPNVIHVLKRETCIEILLDKNRQCVNVCDAENVTPMFSALTKLQVDLSDTCLDALFKHVDKNQRFGLLDRRLLHVACGSGVKSKFHENSDIEVTSFANIVIKRATQNECLFIDRESENVRLIPAIYLLKSVNDKITNTAIDKLFEQTVKALKSADKMVFGDSNRTLLHIACGSGILSKLNSNGLIEEHEKYHIHVSPMCEKLLEKFAQHFREQDYEKLNILDSYDNSPIFYALLNFTEFQNKLNIDNLPFSDDILKIRLGSKNRTVLHLALGADFDSPYTETSGPLLDRLANFCIENMDESQLNATDSEGAFPLIYALKNPHCSQELLRKLSAKINVNKLLHERTVLHIICGCSLFDSEKNPGFCSETYLKFLQVLIEDTSVRIHLNLKDPCGKTALQHAMQNADDTENQDTYQKYLAIIEKIVKISSYDPNQYERNQPKSSLLFRSIFKDEHQLFKILIDRGDVICNQSFFKTNQTILHVLSGASNDDVLPDEAQYFEYEMSELRTFREYIGLDSTDPNQRNSQGRTSLMSSVRNSRPWNRIHEVLRCLLRKCGLLERDNKGKTLLHYMCDKKVKSFKPMQVLLENFQESKDPLTDLVKRNEFLEMRRKFVNGQTLVGDTPLHKLCKNILKYYDIFRFIMEIMLQLGDVDITITNNDHVTAVETFLMRHKHMEDRHFNFTSQRITDVLKLLLSGREAIPRPSLAYAITHYSLNVCTLIHEHWNSDDVSEIPYHPQVISLLKTSSPNLDTAGETALHCAIRIDSGRKIELFFRSDTNSYAPYSDTRWCCMTPEQLAHKYRSKHFATPPNLNFSSNDVFAILPADNVNMEPTFHFSKTLSDFAYSCVKIHQSRDEFNGPSNQEKSSDKILKRVVDFLHEISYLLRPKFLDFKPVLSGSVLEETKVFSPNEYDFLCELNSIAIRGIETLGHSILVKATRSKKLPDVLLNKVANLGYCVCPYKLSQYFYAAIEEVIKSNTFRNSAFSEQVLLRGNKVSTLRITYNLENALHGDQRSIVCHVDLIPGFKIRKFPLKPDVDLGKSTGVPAYVIAKESRHDFRETRVTYQVSFAHWEAKLLKSFPWEVKQGFIVAKGVRLSTVADVDEETKRRVCLSEKLDLCDVITSHMLKTCLFRIVKNEGITGKLDRFDWAVKIYGELQSCLQSGVLTSWGDGRTLFDCSKCATPGGCCKKREFLQTVVRNTLSWLRHFIMYFKFGESLQGRKDLRTRAEQNETSAKVVKVSLETVINVTEFPFSFQTKWQEIEQYVLIEEFLLNATPVTLDPETMEVVTKFVDKVRRQCNWSEGSWHDSRTSMLCIGSRFDGTCTKDTDAFDVVYSTSDRVAHPEQVCQAIQRVFENFKIFSGASLGQASVLNENIVEQNVLLNGKELRLKFSEVKSLEKHAQEMKNFRKFSKTVCEGFFIAKLARTLHVVAFKADACSKLRELSSANQIDVCDVITTRMIKSCLLAHVTCHGSMYYKASREWACLIYEILIERLQSDTPFKSWWNENEVLSCGSACTEDKDCCTKRRLALQIASNIHKFLVCFVNLDSQRWKPTYFDQPPSFLKQLFT